MTHERIEELHDRLADGEVRDSDMGEALEEIDRLRAALERMLNASAMASIGDNQAFRRAEAQARAALEGSSRDRPPPPKVPRAPPGETR